jgi:AraC-like DNA-binding protein
MLTHENIIVILYSLPIYQLLFYAIQLISFKKANPSRKYLGLLLLTMTLFLVVNAFYQLESINVMLKVYPFFIPLLLTLPPVFYLYIFSLARERDQVKRFSKLILFIPGILILILNFLTFGLKSISQREIFLLTDHSPAGTSHLAADSLLIILWGSLLILLIIQLVFAFSRVNVLLKTERIAIQRQPAHLAHVQFKWVYIISVSLLVFVIAGAVQILFTTTASIISSAVFNLFMLISGGLAGYFGMKQDNLLNEVSGVSRMPLKTAGNKRTVQDERMDDEPVKIEPDDEARVIIKRIEALMEQSKPYLNKRFSIEDLSKQIEFRRNKVTSTINDVLGKNFHGLINDYRVREAIQTLETDELNLTMDAVADKVGFHSRSSFYACFKKYTGQTPKEFVAQLKNNANYKQS